MGLNRLSPNGFNDYIYNHLPEYYREMDKETGYQLKKFLSSLNESLELSIDESNGILDIIDPERTPSKVLPHLFKSYGLEVFNGIPESYLRFLLPIIGELWSRKGSMEALKFLTSSITGIRTSTEIVYDEEGNPVIDVRLEMDNNMDDYFPNTEQLNRVIRDFIPFYCDSLLIYAYIFNEEQKASMRSYSYDFVEDVHNDLVLLPHSKGTRLFPVTNIKEYSLNGGLILNKYKSFDAETDWSRDSVRNIISEVGKAGRAKALVDEVYVDTDKVLCRILYRPYHDTVDFKLRETFSSDILRGVHEDSIVLNAVGVVGSNSSVFLFGSPFGSSVFGTGWDVKNEELKDSLSEVKEESVVMENEPLYPPVFLNNSKCLLNIMCLNNTGSYDKITINGYTECVYSTPIGVISA